MQLLEGVYGTEALRAMWLSGSLTFLGGLLLWMISFGPRSIWYTTRQAASFVRPPFAYWRVDGERPRGWQGLDIRERIFISLVGYVGSVMMLAGGYETWTALRLTVQLVMVEQGWR